MLDQFVCDFILDHMDLTEQILKGFALSKLEPEGVHRDVVWKSLCVLLFKFSSSSPSPRHQQGLSHFICSARITNCIQDSVSQNLIPKLRKK